MSERMTPPEELIGQKPTAEENYEKAMEQLGQKPSIKTEHAPLEDMHTPESYEKLLRGYVPRAEVSKEERLLEQSQKEFEHEEYLQAKEKLLQTFTQEDITFYFVWQRRGASFIDLSQEDRARVYGMQRKLQKDDVSELMSVVLRGERRKQEEEVGKEIEKMEKESFQRTLVKKYEEIKKRQDK